MIINPILVLAILCSAIYIYFISWIWRGINREQRKSFSRPMSEPLPLSVIIAAHNEEKDIANTLQSLLLQNYPEEKFEIILAADRCSDGTVQIARQIMNSFKNFELIEILEVPGGYSPKKYAIQCALEKARNHHYLFLDADCVIHPKCLETFNVYFQNEYQAVVSIPKIQSSSRLLFRYLLPERLVTWGICAAAIGFSRPFLAFGALWGYTRQAYDAVGGMSGISHILSGDDDLLISMMGQYQLPIVCCLKPEGWGETRVPQSVGAFITQRRRHHSAGKFYARNVQLAYLFYHISNLLLWIIPFFQPVFSTLLAGKIFIDYILLLRLNKIFKEKIDLLNLISFEIGYLFQHLFIAPQAFLGKIRWK
jgi:cellulose synthase/poly-beta-1,6-N-acetylglucosamine synthase-like glycosyltransferase